MPTGKSSDVIPVRKTTKEALAAVKGRDAFDDLLRELLAVTPPEALRARLDARRRMEAARVSRLRRATTPPPSGELRRSPEKQVLIAEIAEARWNRWRRERRVERLGPRRYRWNASEDTGSEGGAGIRVQRKPGRGLPP